MCYYVYRHVRIDTGTPCYVGKGKGRRAWLKAKRNSYHRNIIDKYGIVVEIMVSNLTEEQAFNKEREFITLYKSLGYCEANFTNGGEGSSGYKHTMDSKQLISKYSANRVPWNKGKTDVWSKSRLEGISKVHKGKVVSKETKIKISVSQSGKRSNSWKGYYHTPFGIFETLSEASDFIKLSRSTIQRRCLSKKYHNWKRSKDKINGF